MGQKNIAKSTRYKVTVSIIFGLIGFAVNFHTISFQFPPYTALILIGFIFPMLIARAWNWKYGLLSALAGGTQSLWWILAPSNGYAIFLIVPPFTLWILWHGYISDLRKKQKIQRWWLNPYIAEIPFRILNTINLYTLSRWAITLNPTPWSWGASASNTIPMAFSNFVVLKQFAVGYVILMLTDVLLNLGFVRKFFGLEEKTDQTNTSYIISISVLFGIIFWVIDSIISSRIFYPESSFVDLFAVNIPAYSFYMRSFFIITCLTGGLIISKQLHKQHKSEKALRKSEEKYHLLADNTVDVIWQMDMDFKFKYVNPSIFRLLGFTQKEWIGSSLSEHCTPERMQSMFNIRESELQKGPEPTEITFETVLLHKSKRLVPVEITAKILFDNNGNPTVIQGTTRNITERKKAEKNINKSLKEKEVLLKEIHHRVKNNLQIISSLLEMQIKTTKNKEITIILSESKNRINTMALIHSLLYKSKDLSKINMKIFINRLSKQLFQSYPTENTKIDQTILVGNYLFPINTAIPIGLIINELLTNSIKHSFKGRKRGMIKINLTSQKGEIIFTVSDDGIGLPTGFDITKTKTLGSHLVKILVENQLQGTMKITSKKEEGTTFKIKFKIETD
ncbi:MAG: PAS domain S-box protein [Candidatus Aenigmarchaeota archaeon]|nr:PAS domain S-box protein [Candidatus Aenigmarchaeota archaeon]